MNSLRRLSARGKLAAFILALVVGLAAAALSLWSELWPHSEARPALIAALCGPFLLCWWFWRWSESDSSAQALHRLENCWCGEYHRNHLETAVALEKDIEGRKLL